MSIAGAAETDTENVVSAQIGALLSKEQSAGAYAFIVKPQISSEDVAAQAIINLCNKGCFVPESTKLRHDPYGAPFLKSDQGVEPIFISLSSDRVKTVCLTVAPESNSRICGVGVDVVGYDQTLAPVKYPSLARGRLFSESEMAFAEENNNIHKQERLAAILSAKEAAFKSLGPLLYEYTFRRPAEELYAEFIEFEIRGFKTERPYAFPFGKTGDALKKIGTFKIDVTIALMEKQAFTAGVCRRIG
jgi:phosphopantetheine--protein transferase-like protein